MALAPEILEEWREAERLLTLLPGGSDDAIAVEGVVEEMRGLYHRVTDDAAATAEIISDTRARIVETRMVLDQTRARLNRRG